MGLAQDGHAEEALSLAEEILPLAAGAAPSEQAALWYTIAVAEHIRGENGRTLTASDRCVALADEAGSPGWAANGLSMRAMALARQGRMEPALIDLAHAEAELTLCEDAGLCCWAHTGLGYAYLELRLYELALPHLVRAQQLDACPIPLEQAPVIDLLNLAELHLRWADELEWVSPPEHTEEDVLRHRADGHAYAVRALALAETLGNPGFTATCRALELCTRPRETAEASLPELRRAWSGQDHFDYQGSRAFAGGALARALWVTGRRREAVEVAREAAAASRSAGDWHVSAGAQWLLVEMEAQSGVPGAAAGRSYGRLLSRVLWHQRLSTLQGAQAALQVERLHRDNADAHRAAREDPLTGISNRRAFDDSLQALVQADPGTDLPASLLVVDLDDFKTINDTYGHVVGDEVLRAVAMAMRGVARTDDVVARLGGDEFVVLARGADAEAGRSLAARLTLAIDALRVGTSAGAISLRASVGVATAGTAPEAALLLARADAAMYAEKAVGHRDRAAADR